MPRGIGIGIGLSHDLKPGGIDVDAQAWATAVAGAGGTVSATRLALMSALVGTLKASPVGWAEMSYMFILKAADLPSARVDVRYPTRVATAGATMVFSADGYAQGNNAADGGFNTLFDPTADPLAKYLRDSNAVVLKITQANTNLPVTYVPDFAEDDGTNYSYINSTDGTGNMRFPANASGDGGAANGGVTTGWFGRRRTASNLTTGYINGASAGTLATASAALLAQTHRLFQYAGGGMPRSNARVQALVAGSGALDLDVVGDAIDTYLAAF